MGSVVHIPLAELPGSESLTARLRGADEIVLENAHESFHFKRETRGPGRTVDEMLQMLEGRPEAVVDEHWSRDLAEVIRQNRAHDRDPSAE